MLVLLYITQGEDTDLPESVSKRENGSATVLRSI
jgi:hypothetical protein